MLTKVADQNSIIRKATLTVFVFSFLHLSVWAQSRPEADVTLVNGQTVLIGLTRGDMLRFSAFNPPTTEAGQATEPLSLRLRFFDDRGAVVAVSPEVVIPPDQFRSVDINYDDLPIAADSTGRKQVRTMPLWGLRSRGRFFVPTSLEIANSTTSAGSFKFFFNVEALP
jgi:hypothetical protein